MDRGGRRRAVDPCWGAAASVLRDSLQLRLDALVADQVDAITRGSAHTAGVGTRCTGWTRLAPGS